jgi:nucleoside-diphosphate-sugar epimerase
MRCAITGAAGYVGSAIAESFCAQGWEVISLGRRRSPLAVAHVPYDLATDPRSLAWDGVDALVHAAYDWRPRGWRAIAATNVFGSAQLLRAAKEYGVRRAVFISSMSAFAGCRSLYGKAKVEIEAAARELDFAAVRPGLVWGGETGGMMRALEAAVARSPVVPSIGGGNFPQYLVHAADLAQLVFALCQPEAAPIALPISAAHPEAILFRSLLRKIAERQARNPVFMPVPWRLILAGLKTLEALRVPAPFRSDSLIGLVFQNPAPDFSLPEMPQISFRPFA